MKKPNAQETDTGHQPESKRKPFGAELKTTKTEQGKTLDSQTNQSLSTSGSNPTGSTTKTTVELLENAAPSGSETTLPLKRPRKPRSLMPVPKLPSETKRAQKALAKLKIKPESLQAAPPITALIRTTVKGGLKVALEAMRFSMEDTEIKAFMRVYDKMDTGGRDGVPWEAIAIAARVNPKHLIGAIQLAVQTHCWNRSRFIAVSNHPEITKARVKYGKMASGEKDRTALDIALGIMQSPKGPTFIGTQQVAVFGGRGKQASKDDDAEDGKIIEAQMSNSDGFDDLFPSPNDIQEKLVPIRQRLLEG